MGNLADHALQGASLRCAEQAAKAQPWTVGPTCRSAPARRRRDLSFDVGHAPVESLEEVAIIKIPGMTYQPPLIGSKKLLNFRATSWPHTGGIALTLAAGCREPLWKKSPPPLKRILERSSRSRRF